MKVKKRKFQRHYDNSTKSNCVRSSRRVLFNFQDPEKKQLFHSDQMYGGGSGILIKYTNKYFLLTARHVLKTFINTLDDKEYQNISPFWIMANNIPFEEWDSNSFLYPHKYYELGEVIPNHHPEEFRDLSLIELFQPMNLKNLPDNFLDLDKKLQIMPKKYFFEGRLLLVSGYPELKNPFEYEDVPIGFTHKTKLSRQIICGRLESDEYGDLISLLHQDEMNHKDLNGFSGGIVTDIQMKSNAVRFFGMAIKGGGNLVRFISSPVIVDAIQQYHLCSCHVIDPGGIYTLMDLLNSKPIEEVEKLIDLECIFKNFSNMEIFNDKS